MKMHRALRLTGGARREGNQRAVIGRGIDVGELSTLCGGMCLEAGWLRAVKKLHLPECRRLLLRQREFFAEPRVAQCVRHLRFIEHLTQFLGAEQWHSGHGNAARFLYRKPARGELRRVGTAQ